MPADSKEPIEIKATEVIFVGPSDASSFPGTARIMAVGSQGLAVGSQGLALGSQGLALCSWLCDPATRPRLQRECAIRLHISDCHSLSCLVSGQDQAVARVPALNHALSHPLQHHCLGHPHP